MISGVFALIPPFINAKTSFHKIIDLKMKSVTFISCLTSLAVAVASPHPKCSSTSVTPCSCPLGTQYQQEVTFGVIGASASEVRAVTLDCIFPHPSFRSTTKLTSCRLQNGMARYGPHQHYRQRQQSWYRPLYQHSHHPRYHHFSRKGLGRCNSFAMGYC